MRVSKPARFVIPLLVLGLVALACSDGRRSVDGVILEVESRSLVELDSFTLRSNEGKTFVFVSDQGAQADPREGIFAGHLVGHMQSAEQVAVHYREEGGVFLATRIEHD